MLRLLPLLLTALLASPAVVSGAEWRTSRDNFCTARCAISERDGVEAFNCPVVDGRRLEFDPRQTSHSGRPDSGGISEDDRYFWDYCTPAPLENIGEEEGGQGTAQAETLPERLDGGSGGSGWNSGSGGSGSNSGSASGLASSLPGVDCQGQCTENVDGYKCRVNRTSSFYCSPESAMDRKQVTSRMKLWCIGKCERKGSKFECRTMAGLDQCSPSRNKTVTGEKCATECREEEEEHRHYKCSTSQDGPASQHCGNWDVSREHRMALEYDDQDRVCAGPCQDRDGDQVCTVVQWAWDEESQLSQLETTIGYCGASKGNMARTIGIVVGCLAAAVLIIVIVAAVVCKNKGYFRANTQEQQ